MDSGPPTQRRSPDPRAVSHEHAGPRPRPMAGDGSEHGGTDASPNGILALRLVLAYSLVVSAVHYVDNTIRYHHYVGDDPTFPATIIYRWVIPVSGVVFILLAALAHHRYVRGRRRQAAALLGAYSISGLIGILHYIDVSPSDFDGFQNAFVVLDFTAGLASAALAVDLGRRPSGGAQATPGQSANDRPVMRS